MWSCGRVVSELCEEEKRQSFFAVTLSFLNNASTTKMKMILMITKAIIFISFSTTEVIMN